LISACSKLFNAIINIDIDNMKNQEFPMNNHRNLDKAEHGILIARGGVDVALTIKHLEHAF
jgi:hypothetical protein